MQRVALARASRSEVFDGEALQLSAMLADDMGNDVGTSGTLLQLSVCRLGRSMPRPVGDIPRQDLYHAALTEVGGLEPLPLEEGHWYVEAPPEAEGMASEQPTMSGRFPLLPKAFSSEHHGKASLRFHAELHHMGTQVLVTVSAASNSDGKYASPVLPLTLGPIWLSPADSDRRARLREGAAWSRRLLHRQLPHLGVTLVEDQGKDATIAGSLWDAGVVLGAYLVHCCVNDPSLLCPRTGGNTTLQDGPHQKLMAMELGCGTGSAGLMLARAIQHYRNSSGPPCLVRVCLTDRDDSALELARLNIAANRVESVAECKRLSWGDMPLPDDCSILRDSSGGPVEMGLVFAADVVYDETRFYPLVQTMYHATGAAAYVDGSAKGSPADAVLAYRLRMDEHKATHFWHLVEERFDVQPAVPPATLDDALRAYGIACDFAAHSTAIFHLRPVLGSPRPTSCLYCSRMLAKRSPEPLVGELDVGL